MTAVGQVIGRTARRGRGLWVALALSLTLNVCFVGGLLWTMMSVETERTAAERFVAIGRGLVLDADQRAALAAFETGARQAGRTLREANAPLMRQIWNEMVKPAPNHAAIAGLIDGTSQNRRIYQSVMTADLIRFLATLTPEQRNQFASLAHRPDTEGRRIFRLSIP